MFYLCPFITNTHVVLVCDVWNVSCTLLKGGVRERVLPGVEIPGRSAHAPGAAGALMTWTVN